MLVLWSLYISFIAWKCCICICTNRKSQNRWELEDDLVTFKIHFRKNESYKIKLIKCLSFDNVLFSVLIPAVNHADGKTKYYMTGSVSLRRGSVSPLISGYLLLSWGRKPETFRRKIFLGNLFLNLVSSDYKQRFGQ